MRITPIAASVATSLLLLSGAANATVTLTGADLTQDQAWRIAQGEEVAISKKAMKQVTDSNRLVMAAARAGVEIYGLTVGVASTRTTISLTPRVTSPPKCARPALNSTATSFAPTPWATVRLSPRK